MKIALLLESMVWSKAPGGHVIVKRTFGPTLRSLGGHSILGYIACLEDAWVDMFILNSTRGQLKITV